MSDAIICVDQKEFRHLVQEEMRSTQIYETLLMIIHELGAQMELDSDGVVQTPWSIRKVESIYNIIRYRMPDEWEEMEQAALTRLLADQEDEEDE